MPYRNAYGNFRADRNAAGIFALAGWH